MASFMNGVPEAVMSSARLDAVRRLLGLHRVPNPVLDRVTRLAAQLVEAPIALLTLVNRDRQYILSAYGLPPAIEAERQTGIEYSICQHAVASGRPLIVVNARDDEVLRHHAAVTHFGVTAYAGMPLLTRDGHPVGTLCVVDLVGRDWTDDQLVALSHLADIAMEEMLAQTDDRPAVGEDEWHAVASRWWRS
jgi:GAF domain-containing protein